MSWKEWEKYHADLKNRKIFYPHVESKHFSYDLEGLFVPHYKTYKEVFEISEKGIKHELTDVFSIMRLLGHSIPTTCIGYLFLITNHPYYKNRKILHVFDSLLNMYGEHQKESKI